MPSKKKKYNSRFPPARIKRIMQADDEVGKVAAVVPVIISRTLEIFVESLLKKASDVTRSRNARTLTPAHLKASINSEHQFRFLREMVATIPDIQPANEDEISETQPSSNNVQNTRGNKRVVARNLSSNNKSKARGRKTVVSRPRVVSQEESEEEEEEDIEESDEYEEGETTSGHVAGGGEVVSLTNSVVDTCSRQPPPIITDQVSLPVVDDDYDNV